MGWGTVKHAQQLVLLFLSSFVYSTLRAVRHQQEGKGLAPRALKRKISELKGSGKFQIIEEEEGEFYRCPDPKTDVQREKRQ